MPIKLLRHLRFLSPSRPVTYSPLMNLKPSVYTSGAIPTLRRAFPCKLKYLGFAITRHNDQHLQLGVRKFSTRSFRTRAGSVSGSEASRDRERGREEIRASKSLIEDDAELSDWVGELGSDSFRAKRINGEEEESDFRKSCGGDRDSFLTKRRRENDTDGLDESNRGVNRNSANALSRSNNSRFDGDFENGNGEPFSRTKNGRFERGNAESCSQKRSARKDRGSFKQEGKKFRRETRFSDDDIGDDVNEGIERIVGGIGNLLNEIVSDSDVSDVDDYDDEDDCTFRKNAKTSIGLDDGGGKTKSSPGKYDSYLSESRFDQCLLSPLSLKGIKDAGYEKMTIVQEASLPVLLKGKDVLAKAKAGTGKTVAFLLPSIEVVIKSPPVGRDQKRPPILVLVVCPTRELATQAAAESNTLLKYHPSIGVQVVIGGTRLKMEQKRMQVNPCQILVATPGRLRDHIENTAGFASRLMGVKVLVLDEADQLLDMGFRKSIDKIIAAVPKERQTLLFSATVPEEVHQICHIALKRDHEFINTVEEGSEETHSQVKQMHLVAPLGRHFPLLYVLLKEHVADNIDYKVLVFCTTAMVTRLVADLLGELKLNVREIHSRKPQGYRTRVSDEFWKSKGLVLVTSDVSARGVDYPDVTLVIQVGLPADREQYIHRLGRTGRKGKEGQGILLLAPWEEFFLSTIRDLPITKAPVPSLDPDTQKQVQRALSHVEKQNKAAAYQAWLGYYNSTKKVGRDKYRLAELANEYSGSMGLDNPPAIPKQVLAKMGLRHIPGLRTQ
ncbi:DEAD-box ATP-dependent RNA helicase 31-like isoform X1 [Mangifera indica]|uniref:DEAD-box ATP-dependent RNA helicase 31-like isoform X1 n=1 Tax=Mangifera indica TaxID=29780 RepID=UPI001CFBDC5D|nr:DEAD-box ATP-dependent RNA helicase 31-like isoform X1 [Mangifera indica]